MSLGEVDGWTHRCRSCGILRVAKRLDRCIVCRSEVQPVKLLDTVKCVVCGKSEYVIAKGKSSRTFTGVCDEHQMELFNAPSKDVPKGK